MLDGEGLSQTTDLSDLAAGGCTLLAIEECPQTPLPGQRRPLLGKGPGEDKGERGKSRTSHRHGDPIYSFSEQLPGACLSPKPKKKSVEITVRSVALDKDCFNKE